MKIALALHITVWACCCGGIVAVSAAAAKTN